MFLPTSFSTFMLVPMVDYWALMMRLDGRLEFQESSQEGHQGEGGGGGGAPSSSSWPGHSPYSYIISPTWAVLHEGLRVKCQHEMASPGLLFVYSIFSSSKSFCHLHLWREGGPLVLGEVVLMHLKLVRQGLSWCDDLTAKVLTKFCRPNGYSKYFEPFTMWILTSIAFQPCITLGV